MFDRKMNLLADMKARWPDLEWKILVSQITHCNYCNHQACPEVSKIPEMPERIESIRGDMKLKHMIKPPTPNSLIAFCSECGAFWWVM